MKPPSLKVGRLHINPVTGGLRKLTSQINIISTVFLSAASSGKFPACSFSVCLPAYTSFGYCPTNEVPNFVSQETDKSESSQPNVKFSSNSISRREVDLLLWDSFILLIFFFSSLEFPQYPAADQREQIVKFRKFPNRNEGTTS